MYQLDNPQYLYFLLALPVVGILFVLYLIWRKNAQKAFGDSALLSRMAPEVSKNKYWFKFVLYSLIICFITIGLVNPQIGTQLETVKRKGVDIVLLLDISKSMLSEDVPPNRLSRAKRISEELLDNLINDRVGFVVYAADAYPMMPMTADYGALRMQLKNADTDLISSQGTGVGNAISLGLDMLQGRDGKNPVIMVLSDGEDHEEGYEAYLEKAKEMGVKIFTIGLGTPEGGPIPVKKGNLNRGYKRDQQGEVVISRLNQNTLKSLASGTGGIYINGRNTRTAIETINEELNKLERQEFEARLFSGYKDQFQWFVGLALVFLLLDTLLFDRKTQWLKKLKLFQHEKK